MRPVGEESRKTYLHKLKNGFFDRYMTGKGAEIGYAGYLKDTVPILENCDGYDLSTPGYDGKHIPVKDNHYDYVYSSHCLEHISDYMQAIQEWYRVVKVGGYIITVVPHRDLYEKKGTLPSRFNSDHKRFYSPFSLCLEFETALPFNSFRVRHLQENDQGHCYTDPPEVHGKWLYEIEMVIQKLGPECVSIY